MAKCREHIVAIQKIVAESCCVSEESIYEKSRKREVVDAKHIFRVELMKRYKKYSF